MRRTLILLIGIWVAAAPSACLALCPQDPAKAEIASATSERSQAPCHGAAPGAERPAPSRAPEPNADCCLEQQLDSSQAGAPESPRPLLPIGLCDTPEARNSVAFATASTRALDRNRIRTPHLQTNPPLLI